MNIFFGCLAAFFAAVLVEFLNNFLVRNTSSDRAILTALSNKHRKNFDEVWKD